MIIECPSCGQRISSKYKTCPHCKFALDGAAEEGDGLSLDEADRRLRIREKARIQAQLYLSIFIAVAGVAWAYASSDGMRQPPGTLPLSLFAGGALWYLIIRLYMLVRRVRG
ncbi:MAG: hypothetical protein AAGE01_01150 [Pseudomonadota bacterium]